VKQDLVRISKFLSFVLRHRPDHIGLALDGGGWAEVRELIDRASHVGVSLSADLIRQVVEEGDKRRFSLSPDGGRIRADYGHSVHVDIGAPAKPPARLYHGTATRYLASIRRDGLLPGGRQLVHLSSDRQTAASVGRRHGRETVLVIESGDMHAGGHEFFRRESGVWLTSSVPVEFIRFPDGSGT
jgi:putative RNA 2'-phosphotransferase